MTWQQRIFRLIIALMTLTAIIGLVAFIFYQSGVYAEFTNFSEFSNSPYGWFMYFIAYLSLKLTFFITPSVAVYGYMPFGSELAVFLGGSAAEITGSIILYILGVTVGVKLINWIAGEKALAKWNDILEKGKYTIFLLLLFPFAPNQLIMMLCGSGKMKLRQYLTIVILAQPIGVLTTMFVGKGVLSVAMSQPLYITIPVFLIGFVGFLKFMQLTYKHQDKIDWLVDKIKRKEN